jgi:transposase
LAGSSCHMQGCLLTWEGMEAFKSINLKKEAF